MDDMRKEEPWYTDPRSIITTPEETAQGFLQQAVRQFEQASVFVERIFQARYKLESSGTTLNDLLEAAETDGELLRLLTAAAGFSEKAINAIGTDEIRRLLYNHILERREELDKDRFVDIILYRYALICGDQLGGVMRNITGQSATQRIVREIVEKVLDRSKDYGTSYLPTGKKRFMPFLENMDDVIIERGLSAIQWSHRVLAFNMKPKFIDKNVDMMLLETSRRIVDRFQLGELLEIPQRYIMCAELKGGIDPAGADEHWKTARSAFERILLKFPSDPPRLAFVGAAIEVAMASEIIERIKNGQLSAVANLCKPEQMERLVDWIVDL